MRHELKCWPDPFRAIVKGDKTVELRLDDRGYGVGDELHLREWDPSVESYSGAAVAVRVTHIVRGPDFGVLDGHVAMSIRRAPLDVQGLSDVQCSFCGKSHREVAKLIAGPTVCICNECVGLCVDIVGIEAIAIDLSADQRGAMVSESFRLELADKAAAIAGLLEDTAEKMRRYATEVAP